MVIYIWFTSKLQKRSYSQLQLSSPQSSAEFSTSSRDSPADKTFRRDSSEVTARAPDKNKKTRLLFMCNRFVNWIAVAQPRKGQIKWNVKQVSMNYLSRYQATCDNIYDIFCSVLDIFLFSLFSQLSACQQYSHMCILYLIYDSNILSYRYYSWWHVSVPYICFEIFGQSALRISAGYPYVSFGIHHIFVPVYLRVWFYYVLYCVSWSGCHLYLCFLNNFGYFLCFSSAMCKNSPFHFLMLQTCVLLCYIPCLSFYYIHCYVTCLV
jgi:hypothetical protein